MLNRLFKKRILVDHRPPSPPFFLKGENLFVKNNGREIFIKKIYSRKPGLRNMGSVIMAPGIACNANLFRITPEGRSLSMNEDNNFANLLASRGFTVYLYHPGYTERAHNRYVCKHCTGSAHYGKRYSSPPHLDFYDLVENEVPKVIDFVRENSGEEHISWIGYSMGGMMIYSYLSKRRESAIKNVITIGSPISLSQIFIRIIPYTNMASKALGFEESAFLGVFLENLVPLTRLIRVLPNILIRYNLISFLLFNPLNIHERTIKTLIGKIVEPIPAPLEKCFADIISFGSSTHKNYSSYIEDLHTLRRNGKNFLFFLGANDLIATPDSVYLAHEIISPNIESNLVAVPSTGHVDLIVGKNSMEKVWKPAVKWLEEKKES